MQFSVSGQRYAVLPSLTGGINVGFTYLPLYCGWVTLTSVAICIGTWLAIE